MRNYYLIILFFFLTSCGFHPRGPTVLSPPLQNLYLQTNDPYGQLTHNLQLYLKMAGVHLAKTQETSTSVLEILSENTSEQLLNISGTQATRQYNLILTVTYQITDNHGNILTSIQTATETRPLTINANQMLSGSNQAVSLYQQMRQAIVYDIMSRLASREISMILTISKPIHP
ncbi:MAG: lptE [Gammaproteobacteria bacterium]|jgi:LPS-assembly lipoprotein|nr:lptE [Gammaproteobacteria bacterium]